MITLYEVAFVSRVRVYAEDAREAETRVSDRMDTAFGEQNVMEVNVMSGSRLVQCQCCGDEVTGFTGFELVEEKYCSYCGRGKHSLCRDAVDAILAARNTAGLTEG